MKKSLVTVMIAALVTMVPTTPSLADLPDAYTSNNPDDLYTIDVDSLTEDELRTAYSTLRDTYAACFQALIDEHAKHIGDGKDPEPEAPIVSSLWMTKYYVDEFNEPTEDAYIANSEFIKGTFSNSATTNSKLNAYLLIDDDSVAIKLFEYGDNVVKGYYDNGHPFKISMLNGGKKREMTGILYDGMDRVFIDNQYLKIVMRALRSGEEIKFYLENTTDNSSYLFTIPASSGFAELYDETFGG